MTLAGFIFAFFSAVILTFLFAVLFKNTGPWKGVWVFFIIVFLVALAVGGWVSPVGPALWGYYWLPGLLAAMVVAFLIAAATATNERGDSKSRNGKFQKDMEETAYYGSNVSPEENIPRDEDVAIVTMGSFFWILIILLLMIIVAGILV